MFKIKKLILIKEILLKKLKNLNYTIKLEQ